MRNTSEAYLRQKQHTINLNECLHPQRFYVELEINDPEGKKLCEMAMSYDQFVRLLLYSGSVPVTLTGYRGTDGSWQKEEVEPPESVQDRLMKRMAEGADSIQGRIADLRRDIYEAMNSGKSVGKKMVQQFFHDINTIEQHFASNVPYFVDKAAEEVSDITDNAKSQLAIFAQQNLGAEMKPEDFTPLIEGDSILALPDKKAGPVEVSYEMKEREEKPIDEMTAMEVGDALCKRLRSIEAAENKYYNEVKQKGDKDDSRKLLFMSGAWKHSTRNEVEVKYISYHGASRISLELARRYLKFLRGIKKVSEFKTHYWFEKGGE